MTNQKAEDYVLKQDEDVYKPETVRALLASVTSGAPEPDEAVARHETPAHKISLPFTMSVSRGAKILAQAAEAEAEIEDFSKTFNYRPWDGAYALTQVMRKYFGTSGKGKTIDMGFFGTIPPQNIEIEVAYGKTESVPWGRIEFAPLEGTIDLGSTRSSDYGLLFALNVSCPKRFKASVHGLFRLIEEELKSNSLYKGKAIRGTDEPKFLPLSVDDSIVYNDSVYASLDQSVWGVLRHKDLLSGQSIKTDPKVLLHGPYGTGKSEAGRITAKYAVDNGWTFISYNSGEGTQDDLKKTIQTARLLAPSVVFVEDVDIYAEKSGDPHSQSRLLEMFDGISSKGHEVMILMTSNKPENFSKPMLRAGRINKMIEIGPLDKAATEKLIRKVNAGKLADDIDFEAIHQAVEGFEPAFVRQTFDDARQAALIRNADMLNEMGEYTLQRALDFKLQTQDFITAANVMRPQHNRHTSANDASGDPTFDDLLKKTVVTALGERLYLEDSDGGEIDVVVLPTEKARDLSA